VSGVRNCTGGLLQQFLLVENFFIKSVSVSIKDIKDHRLWQM